jgi:hypothetical protein
MDRRLFSQQPSRPFPSISTLFEDNCVSLHNFTLYVKYVPNYSYFSYYLDRDLDSAINKISVGMSNPQEIIWLTDNEKYIIKEIIKVIQSLPQEYFGKKTKTSEINRKKVCPNLLDYLQRSANIHVYGGKTRRRTNKQKRRKYYHKSKKTSKARYLKRN